MLVTVLLSGHGRSCYFLHLAKAVVLVTVLLTLAKPVPVTICILLRVPWYPKVIGIP